MKEEIENIIGEENIHLWEIYNSVGYYFNKTTNEFILRNSDRILYGHYSTNTNFTSGIVIKIMYE